jgi:anti-anti-sigma regulatory factor
VSGPESPEGTFIQLEGTVGLSVARELRSMALDASLPAKSLTLKCSKVDRFDLNALQTLQALANQLAHSGAQLHIVGVSDAVRDYVRLAGFGSLLGEHGP